MGIANNIYLDAIFITVSEFCVNGNMIRLSKVINRMIIAIGCQKFLKSLADGER